MSRTKGAKDKKPRNFNPASLAGLPKHVPGCKSVSVRLYGPSADMNWFAQMTPPERAQLVVKLRKEIE